ncbi:MAG: restriction endonuclease subunit S [Thermodesulfobacteriota bacterium]
MTSSSSFVPSCLRVSDLLEQHFDTAFAAPAGIAKLRELILTLAMQGKLVEQDPNDPPASELLKEIEAEKQQLVKAGKIKKPKPLPPIKPEEVPYELPEGWEWARLGEITEYNGRKNISGDEIAPDTWLLDLEDIEKGTSRILFRAKFSERQSKSTKSTFQKGDVLYGKLRPYLDKVVVADADGVCTTEIVPIVPFNGIHSEFLRWLLKRPAFITHVNSLMYGVKMPRLGTDDALTSIHPLPPLPEQHRIVARINQLMTRCDELEKLHKQREEKRLAVHAAAIKQLLDPPDLSAGQAGGSAWDFIQQHFDDLYTVKENVAELRKAILQLAVMGRLVPPACRQAGKTPTTLPPPEPGSWWVYVIECENGSFYKGFTEDLPRRWRQHLSGTASEWTKKHPPKQVYYWEKCFSKEAAIKREDYLKSGFGREWFKREVVDNQKAWQTASELLKEIEAEKQRLMKAGKIKKPKPVPPIKPEEVPYQLPQGWEWVRFGKVASNRLGKMLDKSKNRGNPKPYLRNTNVQWHQFVLDDVKEMKFEDEELDEFRVLPGDLLICEGGEPGRCAIWRDSEVEIYFQKAIHRARPFSCVTSEYLQVCLTNDGGNGQLEKYFTGATIKHFPGDKLNGYVIPLPPLPEQHRIVARIDQLMALCDTLDQQIDAATGKKTELLDAVMARLSADTAQV